MPRIQWRKVRPGRAAQLVLLLMTLPLLWQCIKTPLEPVAPKFTTQLAIPLVDKIFFFADIVNKDSKFDTTTTQILYNPTKDAIGDRIGIPASVFVMDTTQLRGNTINSELGVVPISVPNIQPVSATASLLFPALVGQSIPPFPLPSLPGQTVMINQSVNASPDGAFTSLVFENGTMSLKIQNTFPFAVQFQGNQLFLYLDGDTTSSNVAAFTFSGKILSGETQTSALVPLDGKTMLNILRVKGTVTTDAYSGPSVTITGTMGLTITPTIAPSAGFSDVGISSAVARLSTDFSNFPVTTIPDSAVKLSDSIRVKTADFRAGTIRILLQNAAPLAVVVRFRIDEFIDKRTNAFYKLGDDIGQPGDSLITIDAKSSIDVTIPMSQFRFVARSRDLLTGDTIPTRFLHFSLQIKTLVKNTSYQNIKKTDYVFASVQPTSQFVLESVYGQIPPKPLLVDQTFEVGIGDIGDRLTLKGFQSQIKLQIGVLSTGLFPTDADLWVVPMDANNHRGDSVHILQRIQPGVKGVIDLSSTNVNTLLNAFLSGPVPTLPSKMQVLGSTTVSPMDVYNSATGIGSVKQGDSVFVTLNYTIPVAIGIKDGFLWDTTSIAENNIDTARIHLITEGKIHFTLTNAFPMALDLTMKLMKGQDTLLTIPQPGADAIKIDADTSTSNPRTGMLNYRYIAMTPADAAKLNDATKVYIGLSMRTGNDNGATAKVFNKSDFVRVKTFANITFDVDFDRLK